MLLVLALILPALFAGRAATASNAVPAGPTGSGTGSVSGYTVASVSYSLVSETVAGVSFTLSPDGAATVKARLAPSEPWTACTVSGGSVSCPLSTGATDAISLEVFAAG